MLLNVDTVLNDSKKISELRKLTKITKHQENTWIPIAQYNSRTDTYTNAAINLQAVTSYNIGHAYSYIAGEFGSYWIDLLKTGVAESTEEIGYAISNSSIANNILSYTFTYTVRHFDWQIAIGTYIPDYYAPLHPDESGERQPMEAPDFSLIGKLPEPPEIEDEEDNGNEDEDEIYDSNNE